jgi:hypothetical protein
VSRFYWLMITILIFVAIAFLLGWFQVSTTSDEKRDKVNVELTLDKAKVKDDAASATAKAQELGQKTKEEARDVARKIGNLAGSDRPVWSIDRKSIEVISGQSADVILTRTGDDLKSMQAGLFPSAGSNLLASGGLFKEGEKNGAHYYRSAP